MLSENLQQLLNINEKDSRIYLDLLSFGSSAASTVATRTQLDRTTTYSALKRMKQRGFITESRRQGTALFDAIPPHSLEVKMEQEIQQRQRQLMDVKSLIPELAMLRSDHSFRPAVQIFEGVEGVIALYELMLKKNRKQDAFLKVDTLPVELKPYLCHTYIQHKKNREVHSRVLVNDSVRARSYQALDSKANRETKLIPQGFLPFETEIIIGEKEIATIDLRGDFIGVLIKSLSIRNTLAALFDLVWKVL